MQPIRLIQVIAYASLGLVVAGLAVWYVLSQLDRPSGGRPTVGVTLPAGISMGGDFALTDHRGQAVTPASYDGRHLLIYFGYSYCPDICPTELGNMALVMDALGSAGDRVQPLFITVDPKRDTVAHLAEYVGLFHPKLDGLTGTRRDTAAAAKAFRVYFKLNDAEDPENYLVDHTSFIYLTDPAGKVLGAYGQGTEPEAIATEIKGIL